LVPGYGTEAADAAARGNLIPGVSDWGYRTGSKLGVVHHWYIHVVPSVLMRLS
jgi:hypothetical protein